MTDLQKIQQRTESTIDTNINEINCMLNEVKTDLQLSGPDKANKISILRSNLNVQMESRRIFNSLMTDVKVKY